MSTRPNTASINFIMGALRPVVVPKHMTPNYRQVRHEYRAETIYGRPRVYVSYTWEAMPLRADRKDLSS
jgi:hypothetical protein